MDMVLYIYQWVLYYFTWFINMEHYNRFNFKSKRGMESMNKETLIRVVLPILAVGWMIGIFFMGWKTILWTGIGIAIGLIIKYVKENTIV